MEGLKTHQVIRLPFAAACDPSSPARWRSVLQSVAGNGHPPRPGNNALRGELEVISFSSLRLFELAQALCARKRRSKSETLYERVKITIGVEEG